MMTRLERLCSTWSALSALREMEQCYVQTDGGEASKETIVTRLRQISQQDRDQLTRLLGCVENRISRLSKVSSLRRRTAGCIQGCGSSDGGLLFTYAEIYERQQKRYAFACFVRDTISSILSTQS